MLLYKSENLCKHHHKGSFDQLCTNTHIAHRTPLRHTSHTDICRAHYKWFSVNAITCKLNIVIMRYRHDGRRLDEAEAEIAFYSKGLCATCVSVSVNMSIVVCLSECGDSSVIRSQWMVSMYTKKTAQIQRHTRMCCILTSSWDLWHDRASRTQQQPPQTVSTYTILLVYVSL